MAALPSEATVLVNDTWLDGTRTDPAAPVYSENGTDLDSDGNLESAWFSGGTGASATASSGHLVFTMGSSAGSWTTYFTPEASPVTLAGPGDQLKVTWVFTPTGVNTANTSQGFPIALVDTPTAQRISTDTSPGSASYTGYGVFMNMGQTLGNNHPFQLMARTAGSGALLSDSGQWTGLADGATSGNHGYDSGTQYTFVMTITRNAANGLDLVATMTGGTLNGTGVASASFTDATPNGGSYTFDTFALRPNTVAKSASSFDTTLFKVEFIPGSTPPAVSIDPQDQSVLTGEDATFSVVASGTLPLAYQWYFNTNTQLDFGTNSVLTLTNVQLTNAGTYAVVVTNAYGSATSAVAQLTVSLPVAPVILTQPQDQTNLLPGATATFSVTASGSDPLSYQWYYNTNTLLTNASSSILTLTNVQPATAGAYSVVVNNPAGSVTSSNALLSVSTSPTAPVFTTQPASQVVLLGGTANFAAVAAGTAPITYQWSKNGVPISGATSTTLTLTNVQSPDAGSYAATASNSVGSVTSSAAALTVTATIPLVKSAYNLVGFGRAATGGGLIPDTDPAYAKVTNPLELATAVRSFNKTGGTKVIEIMNDLDLGWIEIGTNVQKMDSSPFSAAADPQLHPVLLQTGVSKMDIKYKNGGLTIFSANGATIRHCTFNIKSTHNIIVRNLKFDEMWEWDEATKGQYDKNDWDFIDLANGGPVYDIWIDHCTFTKAYDGIVDMKAGSTNVTLSWCKYTGDDGATNTNSFVRQQINVLEANRSSYTFYNFLRNNGFSLEEIVQIIQGHDKTHLMGANSLKTENVNLSATFHHLWLHNCWDRVVPRLRTGNVHDFNLYVDDTEALAAKRLRDARQLAMSQSASNALKNTYSFNPPLNGSISTEGGAILVEKSVYIDCLYPLRDNQTDVNNTNYTGKILGLDVIYQMDNTVIRGNSTDPGNPLGPFQAKIHFPFSWNPASGAPGGQLPYTYTPDDPGQLQSLVTSPTAGAGAGVLTWDKTNWLVTSYPATAPYILTPPQDQTVSPGSPVSFSVFASGSAPLNYQWYFNTNTPISGATNPVFSLASVQGTNAGTYAVVISNSAGAVISSNALLTVSGGTPSPPQLSGPVYDAGSGTFSLTIAGDPGLDYIVQVSTNLTDWISLSTNHSAVPPFVWTDAGASNFSWRFYRVRLGP
ncbi:MAG TPA: immunoglobulin domain-containing protein [Candidatus Acidoferrum sp.]|nr:immunoglobulin domain-containing protein [Candidatus Acidoferrum sp.]